IELSVAERALGRCQTRCSSRVHPDASQLLASHFSCSRPGIVVSLVQTDCSNPGSQQPWHPATLRDSMTTVSQMPIARLRDVSKIFDPEGAAVTALPRLASAGSPRPLSGRALLPAAIVASAPPLALAPVNLGQPVGARPLDISLLLGKQHRRLASHLTVLDPVTHYFDSDTD